MSFKNFLVSLTVSAMIVPSASLAAYEFSTYNFARNPSRVDNQMRIEMKGRTSLRSYRFVGKVGGINFESEIDLSGLGIDLDYDHSRPDGQRAFAIIDGSQFTIPLYDWELKPIVSYADSPYTAVVSIFGEGDDMENFRYINYHPAFEDTHIGVRLMQADIIFMDPFVFSEAPTEGGKKVYLQGERMELPSEERIKLATQVNELFMGEESFQAWVLTDTDMQPAMNLGDGALLVDLTPYFYFWKSETNQLEEDILRYDALVEAMGPMIAEYDALMTQYVSGSGDRKADVDLLNRMRNLQLFLDPGMKELDELRARIEKFEPEVEEVTTLVEKVKGNYGVVKELAPFVFDTVEKTAQYAALFRGAKRVNKQDWDDFRSEVSQSIELSPVETPNQFTR
jgi:hypothetical protein